LKFIETNNFGSADMLEVASMGLHVTQMTGVEQMKSCFRAVTEIPAAILGLEGYGLEKGCNADLVILQAADPVEALRLKSNRLFVIRRGNIISSSQPVEAKLDLPGRPKIQNYLFH
jgi:cytosine deaminase